MTYDIGFIGYGLMGRTHANALETLPMFFPETPETNRHIIAGRNEDVLESAATRLGFDRTTSDWHQVIPQVDVLYNLTPNHLHPEPSIEALSNDTHVLCEKPLASTLEDGERMVQAAESSDAAAGCAFNYRYVPALAYIKELVDEGTLGTIRHFRGQYLQDFQADVDDPWIWRNDSDVAGYGRVGDVGAHTIDLAHWLVGGIDQVSGTLSRFVDSRPDGKTGEPKQVTTDDAYGALLEFDCGAQGVIEGSRVATGHKNTNAIELIGSRGAVRYDVERFNEVELKRQSDQGFQRISVTETPHPYMDAWWPAGHGIGWEHTFVHENLEFLTSIQEGTEYRPNFSDAFTVQEVVDAIVESNREGKKVVV